MFRCLTEIGFVAGRLRATVQPRRAPDETILNLVRSYVVRIMGLRLTRILMSPRLTGILK